ncbi:MAG TPA: protein kinase [Gemmataceae bacterium]|nr:protein kinase [Gemmataceae bacterium]
MTEEALFLAALDRPDLDERRRFLDDACAGNPGMRKRIDILLAAFAAGKDKLEPPPNGDETRTAPGQPATIDYRPGAEPGTIIAGRYKLLERIGEGGMGEVWVAKQTEPVQRKVALKLIKAGMDSRQVLVRFEAERQALALMDHPHIAKVLDGGLTADQRPYFVMELVNGQPLTKFCDEARLTPRERLELFVPVCQAIQHAHQKGIVHRDLKPTNILVTLYDGRPVPKVIDFGVAKATAGRLTEETLSTQFGAVVGTFEYMAPEQAGFSALDVDTRADVYSLGVILYELLTGLRPFEGSRLRKAAIDELFRILREEEPPRPSTKLSTDASLPSAAAVRRTDPKRLAALMRGELDWIVMKCLEKDRSRRYETVGALARDVERYLADEPVEARPPSAGYRARKFVRRNRSRVIAAALVLLVLVAGVIGTTAGLIEARGQRDAARRAEQQADADRALALSAARRAEDEGGRARLAEEEQAKARKQVEAALLRSDGLRLGSEAVIARATDPGLSLLLALEGVRRFPHRLTYSALYDAAAELRERRTLATGLHDVRGLRLSPDGTQALVFGSNQSDGAATVMDLATGKRLASWHGFGSRTEDTAWSPDGSRAVSKLNSEVTVVFTDGQKPEHATFTERVAYVWDARTGRDLAHLRGHEDKIASVQFSPDGRKILTASWDGTARLWDAVSGKQLHVLRAHTNALLSARFSPDGKRVLTVSSQYLQSHYRDRDPDTGKTRYDKLPNPDPGLTTRPYRAQSWSSGSSFTTAARADHPLARLWDAETGEEKAALVLESDQAARRAPWSIERPHSAAFSPDGTKVAIGFDNDLAAVWDATGGEPRAVFRGHRGRTMAVAFDPYGTELVTAGDNGAIVLWDLRSRQLVRRFEGHGPNTINDVRFSPDGRWLVSAGYDRTARVWHVKSGKELGTFRGHDGEVRAAHFLPDQETVLSAGDRNLRVWSIAPPPPVSVSLYEPDPPSGRLGELFGKRPARHSSSITAVAFAQDGRTVYTGSADHTVQCWDIATGRQKAEVLNRLRGAVTSLHVGPGGLVYAGTELSSSGFTEDGDKDTLLSMVHRWDPATGKATRFLKGQNAGVLHLELSRDGRRILLREQPSVLEFRPDVQGPLGARHASDPASERVSIWDAQTGERLSAWPVTRDHQGLPRPRFSHDGTTVVCATGTDQFDELALFDAHTGQRLRALAGSKDQRGSRWWDVRFTPDGRLVVGQRFGDRNLWFWAAATGERLGSFVNTHPTASWQPVFALSPDSKRVAVAVDRVVQLVDVATRTGTEVLRGHEGPVTALAFSPDGTRLLSGSEDRTAVLWDVESARLLTVYRGHAATVTLVAFSPDGTHVATVVERATLARVWPADVVPEFERRKPRELTPEERSKYELPPAPPRK